VQEQLNALKKQQDNFIKYYTAVSVDTVNYRLTNAHYFAGFIAKLSFMNTLFSNWTIADANPELLCTEITVDATVQGIRNLHEKSSSHNSPVLNNKVVSSYYTSTGMELSDMEKQEISKHIGTNMNSLNFGIQHSTILGNNKQVQVLIIMILTNIKDAKDFRGIYHLFPGSCGDIDLLAPYISRQRLYHRRYG
jgi:hypothetical protein